jgi:hypothetical protein
MTRDRIFSATAARASDFVFDRQVAAAFDDMVARGVGGRDFQLRLRLAPEYGDCVNRHELTPVCGPENEQAVACGRPPPVVTGGAHAANAACGATSMR